MLSRVKRVNKSFQILNPSEQLPQWGSSSRSFSIENKVSLPQFKPSPYQSLHELKVLNDIYQAKK